MITVLIYRIITSYSGYSSNYLADRYIHIQFDETTKAITTELKASSDPDDSVLVTPTDGPNIFSSDGSVTRAYPVNLQIPVYKQCDGVDLDYVSATNNFPYCTYTTITGSPECAVSPVCDLEMSSSYTMTPASGPDVADGSLSVSATSSNGTPKYSLESSFDYSAETNVTGSFPSILPGEYTIYCKDELGCVDSITIVVTVTDTYAVKYRVEYKDVSGLDSRIDILERGYSGDITIVRSGDNPFSLEYKADGNDQYKSVIPSEARIQLRSSIGQFEEIFTSDDRKYQVKFYKDLGDGYLLKWMGFCLPEFYQEPYVGEEFTVTITATDGLAELEYRKFRDSSGNIYKGDLSAIKIISEILKTTSLTININSCVNIYEANMDETAADDPLSQVYIDTRMYYNEKKEPKDMKFVISSILEAFGARIFQSRGVWWIQRIEYTVQETISFREFTFDGIYSSNGTLTTLYDLAASTDSDRAVYKDRSPMRGFLRNYGLFEVIHDLSRDDNLIDEGRFEIEDLVPNTSGDYFFKNWGFLIGQPNMSFGLEKLPDSTGAFFATFNSSSSTSGQNDSQLYTYEIPINVRGDIYGIGDKFKILFDLAIVPYRLMPWVRFAWQVRIKDNDSGDYYDMYPMKGDMTLYEINQEVVNNIYITDYNTFKKIDLGYLKSPVSITNGTIQVTLRFHSHSGRDIQIDGSGDGYDSLRDVPTDGYAEDYRLYWTNGTITRDYRLVATTDDEEVPDRIRPTDYGALSNPRQWEKQADYFVAPGSLLIQKVLIDNFQISFYPFITNESGSGNIQPPAEVIYEKDVNSRVKSILERPLYLGDVPDFNNSSFVYKGYFKLSDGTPTAVWHRKDVTEEDAILEILLKDLESQLTNPPRKLTGSVRSDGFIDYIFFLKDNIDDRRYMNTIYQLDDKISTYYLELINVVTGADGEPPAPNNYLLQEDGFRINNEEGGGTVLETTT